MNSGSFPPGFWNAQASQLIVRRHMRERDAARTLAVMNAAGMDALIGSHEAKFTYWLLRPSQADPAIRLAIPLPNFPSYPSNHAALSSAEATVLARVFPEERDRLVEMADDAAISRIYGGIHYRFDATAGLELGRRIAGRALEAERAGRLLTAFR
jgi:membrane-associated phospholipid phosphatase